MPDLQSIPESLCAPLDSTRRWWLRSPEVALGEFKLDDNRAYWRWDLRTGNVRIHPLCADSRLLRDAPPEILQELGSAQILGWKPESRLIWQTTSAGLRVCRKWHRASHREVRSGQARWFASQLQARSPSLIEKDRLPLQTWEWVRPGQLPERLPLSQLAGLLKCLHGAPAPSSITLPRLDDRALLEHVGKRLAAFHVWQPVLGLPLVDLSGLQALHASLAGEFTQLPAADEVVVHGDFRRRNLVFDARNQSRLLDADHLALAPAEWDLAALLAETTPAEHDEVHEFILGQPNIDARRLSAYVALWHILIALKRAEDGEP